MYRKRGLSWLVRSARCGQRAPFRRRRANHSVSTDDADELFDIVRNQRKRRQTRRFLELRHTKVVSVDGAVGTFVLNQRKEPGIRAHRRIADVKRQDEIGDAPEPSAKPQPLFVW